jgi:hypothetical protein
LWDSVFWVRLVERRGGAWSGSIALDKSSLNHLMEFVMLKQKGLLGLMVAGFGLSMVMPGQAQQVVLTPAGTAFLAPPVQPQQQPTATVLKAEEASEVAYTMTAQSAVAPSQLAADQKQAIEKHGRFAKYQGREIEILAVDDPRIPIVDSRKPYKDMEPGYIAVLDPTRDFMGNKAPGLIWVIPESYILTPPPDRKYSMEDVMRGNLPPEFYNYKNDFSVYTGPIEPIATLPVPPIIMPTEPSLIEPQPISILLPLLPDPSFGVDRIQTVTPTLKDDGFYATAFSQGVSMANFTQQEIAAARIPSIAAPASDSTVIPSSKTNGNLRLIPTIDYASPLSASRILPDLR